MSSPTTVTTPATSVGDVADTRRFRALGVIVLAQLMVVLDASIVTVALPSAQAGLHISVAERQWVFTAYTLAFGGLLLLGGGIADFVGRKRIFEIGLVGFGAPRPWAAWPRTRPCSSEPAHFRGLGTALLNTIAATAAAGYVAGHGPSAAARAVGLVHGYTTAFYIGAVFLGLSAVASLLLVRARRQEA